MTQNTIPPCKLRVDRLAQLYACSRAIARPLNVQDFAVACGAPSVYALVTAQAPWVYISEAAVPVIAPLHPRPSLRKNGMAKISPL